MLNQIKYNSKMSVYICSALSGHDMRKFNNSHRSSAVQSISLFCESVSLFLYLQHVVSESSIKKLPMVVLIKRLKESQQQAVSSSLNALPYFAFQGKSCDEGRSFLTEVPDSPAAVAYQIIVQSKSSKTDLPHT